MTQTPNENMQRFRSFLVAAFALGIGCKSGTDTGCVADVPPPKKFYGSPDEACVYCAPHYTECGDGKIACSLNDCAGLKGTLKKCSVAFAAPNDESDDDQPLESEADLDSEGNLGSTGDPACGDGIKDPTEECDDGAVSHSGPCPDCILAFCGDGFVWEEVEECDDLSAPANSGCHNCSYGPLRVFITYKPYAADLSGVAGADLKCLESAAQAGLDGTFIAWTTDFFPMRMRLASNLDSGYELLNGTPIAYDWDDLVGGSLLSPININEYGDKVAVPTYVWTGVTSSGEPSSDDCYQWTSLVPAGTVGNAHAVDSAWTEESLQPCEKLRRLYCFEVRTLDETEVDGSMPSAAHVSAMTARDG